MTPVELAVTKDAFAQIARMPPKVQKKVLEFIDRFRENPKAPSIHYEPIADFKDDRARTVRIGDDYRAIVVSPRSGNRHLLAWIDHHDEAMRWARNKTFDVHPILGSLQIVDAVAAERAVEGESSPPKSAKQFDGSFGHLTDEDLIGLGVPEPLVPSARRVHDEKSFYKLSPHLPEEAREGLEWIAVLGGTVDQAREFVAKDRKAEIKDREDFGPATETPDGKQRFVTIRSGGDLEQMLQGPLNLWRVFLHPDQRRLVEQTYKGPVRVLGGAGTGKTVVAMHRAHQLAEKVFTKSDERVLFTTFSKSLAQDVAFNLRTLYGGTAPARIEVTHLHSWAVRFLKREGIDISIVPIGESRALWDDVIARHGLDRFTRTFVLNEWTEVVQALGVRTAADYLRVSRRGRGGPRLVKKDREFLWSLFESYRAGLDDKKKVEYIDTIRLASERLASKPGRLPYAAVVVDEAQDFGPEELKLIRALVPKGANDLFFVGDAYQRIFASPVTMASCGIDIRGRGYKLRINYRTSHEIRRWATAFVQGITVDDLDGNADDLKGYTSLFSGPEPEVAWFASQEKETTAIVAAVKALAVGEGKDATCVIAPTGWLLDNVYGPALEDAGVPSVKIDKSEEPPTGEGVRLCTMHRAKGLEFRHVIVAGLGDDRYPHPIDAELDDSVATKAQEARQRSLLFVASTRARETLHVSGFGRRTLV